MFVHTVHVRKKPLAPYRTSEETYVVTSECPGYLHTGLHAYRTGRLHSQDSCEYAPCIRAHAGVAVSVFRKFYGGGYRTTVELYDQSACRESFQHFDATVYSGFR